MSGAKACRYCTKAERTVEHALATQLAKVIPRPSALTAERLTLGTSVISLSEWQANGLDVVHVRQFCADCNGGFMNDLDCGVKAEFAEVCLGSPMIFDSEAIGRWAPWAVKQYFSYQCAYPEDMSRPTDFHRFYAERTPLPGMQVFVGRGDGSLWPHCHGRRPLYLTPMFQEAATRELGLQLWTVSYGQLVVQVIHAHDERLIVPERPAEHGLAKLWPAPTGSVDLADFEPVTFAGFAELTKFAPIFEKP